jgi:AraC family transcriptional regulator
MLTDWIAALDGKPVRERSFAQSNSLGLGHHRFDGLPDFVRAPEISHHYVSVTLSGDVDVDGMVSGKRMSARVGAGQVIIMAAGQSNSWRWSRPTEEAHVFLAPWLMAEVAEDIGSGRPEVLNRCAVDDPHIRQIVLGLVDELDHGDGASRAMLDSGARYLAHHLLRRHCASPSLPVRPSGLSAAQFRKVEALVTDGLSQGLGLTDMAKAAGLSPYHFARRFKAATDETPHAYLTRRRMEQARHLIATSGLTMIEVAHRVGFESQSHFGQVFRATTGVSPAAYRQRSRS